MSQIQITPAWFPLRPHPTQSKLWHTRARFVCLPSGRGSGKTEIAKRRLALYTGVDRHAAGERPEQARNLKHMYAYLGPTRQWAKRVAWDHLKSLVPPSWYAKPPSESDLVIYVDINGHKSELHVIGMDKPARFEGDQWDGVVEDEASDQKPNIHLSVRPAIAFKQGWWWKIGIPKRQGSGAPAYRAMCKDGINNLRWYEEMLAKAGDDGAVDCPDVLTYSWPSWDILPQSEVDDMRRRMDPKDFNEQVGGQWENIGGAAFYCFEPDVHVRECAYDPTLPLIVSCDFNVTPMCWIIAQSPTGFELEVIDELWLRDTHTKAALDVLWDRWGTKHQGAWEFYGDAAARQRKTSAAFSDYALIANDQRFKARVTFPDANPRRKDRLSSCNALLRNAFGEVRCHIDPRCSMLIADLESRGLEPSGDPIEAKTTGGLIGHISDAFGYVIHTRWPSLILTPEEGATAGIHIHRED